MSDLMELLYEYAESHRVAGFLDSRAYGETERLEERNLAALRKDLTGEGLAALERYQDVCLERQDMNLEAMFRAGFSIAQELLR